MHPLILRYRKLLLFIAAGLFFIVGLGGWDLTAPDEPRFALVAREMIETGNYLFPHRNERAYPDKPPLFFWSIAALSPLTGGVNEWSARLPSALSAILCLFLIGRWAGSGRWHEGIGLMTILVLATGIQFMQQAHNAQIDMLLCVLVLGASLLGYRRLQGEPVSEAGIGVLLGLAILAKGPVGYLIPAGTWLVYCLFSGSTSWKHYPAKALLWGLIPPLLWIGGLTVQVWLQDAWEYWENLLFKQTVVRYTNAWHHHKPFYYFIKRLLIDFFPWSLFLLAAIPWKSLRRQELEARERFAWAAILFILLFFSLSSGKRHLYIVPLYPFAAYLVARYIKTRRPSSPLYRILLLPGALVITVFGMGLLGIAVGWLDIDELTRFGNTLPRPGILLCSTLIVAGGVITFVDSFREKRNSLPKGVVLALLSMNLLYYQVVAPWISPFRSVRAFAEQTESIAEGNEGPRKLGMVDFRSGFRFFGNRHVTELSTLDPSRQDPKLLGLPTPHDFWRRFPAGLVIIRRQDLEDFQKSTDPLPEFEVLLDQSISDDQFLLLARAVQNTSNQR